MFSLTASWNREWVTLILDRDRAKKENGEIRLGTNPETRHTFKVDQRNHYARVCKGKVVYLKRFNLTLNRIDN